MPGGRLVVTPQAEQPGCDYILSAFTLSTGDNDTDTRGGHSTGGGGGGGGVDPTPTWRTVASGTPLQQTPTGGGTAGASTRTTKKKPGRGLGPGSGLGLELGGSKPGVKRGLWFEVGEKVEVNYEGMGAYFPGVISSCSQDNAAGGGEGGGGEGALYNILYNDGDTETDVPAAMIKRTDSHSQTPDNPTMQQQQHQQQQEEEEKEEDGGPDEGSDNEDQDHDQAAVDISALSHQSHPSPGLSPGLTPGISRGLNPGLSPGITPGRGRGHDPSMRLNDDDGRIVLVPGVHRLTVVFKPDDDRWPHPHSPDTRPLTRHPTHPHSEIDTPPRPPSHTSTAPVLMSTPVLTFADAYIL